MIAPSHAEPPRGDVPPGYGGGVNPGRFLPLVPRQLPEPQVRLWGRETELNALDAVLADGRAGPVTALICGPPGAGKTALAVQWLHQHRDQAPDGHLYARLAGVTGLAEAPHEILGRWLRALGMPPAWVPPAYRDRIRLWRAVSAVRQLAVLIDDTPSAAVIAALQPSTGLAVATSRRALGGRRDGISRVRLGPLKWRPAAVLLAGAPGNPPDRLQRPGELARACGGLPLALRCAARLTSPPGLPAVQLAGQLDAGRARLIARGIPRAEARVRAVIEAAIGTLTPETAHALRLLALCPGPEISTGLAAAVLRVRRGRAGAVLDALARAALLDQPDLSRGQLHPLVHAHARAQAADSVPAAERRAVTGRILTWYAEEASRAESALAVGGGLRTDTGASADLSAAQAAGWADRHGPAMLAILAIAVDRREHLAVALRLAGALWPLLRARGDHDGQLTVARLGVRAARAYRDRAAGARMHARTGQALVQLGQPAKAVACLRRAAGMWQQIGDDGQLAATHRAYGQALMALHRPADAATCFTAALADFERGGQERDIGVTLIGLAEALIAGGHETDAAARLRQARPILSAQPDLYHQARAQCALGMALAQHPQLATAHLQQALRVMRRLGCLPEQATILQALGDLAARDGQPAHARRHYQQVLAMLPGTHPASQQVRESLQALDEPAEGGGHQPGN